MGIEGFTEYDTRDAELYNRYRWWSGLTWGDVLDRASDLYPRKVGLADDRSRMTYGELRQMVDRLALGLMDLGIEPTDRVLLQIPNWCEFVWAFFALEKIGAIPVLLLPRHNEIEITYLAKLTAAKAWILPLSTGGSITNQLSRRLKGNCRPLSTSSRSGRTRAAGSKGWKSLRARPIRLGRTCAGSWNEGLIPWRLA